MEQANQDEGSDRWWKYERMILKIEDKLGATKRSHLKVVKWKEKLYHLVGTQHIGD